MEKSYMEEIGHEIIGSALTVHRKLGPGLLERVYELCMLAELRERGIRVDRQVTIPIFYNDIPLNESFRLDLLVEGTIIIEIKAVETFLPVFESQLLTYMKLTGKNLGYLLNFNVPLMKQGIHRMVLNY